MLSKVMDFLKKETTEDQLYISNSLEEIEQEKYSIAIDEVLNHFINLVKTEFCDDKVLDAQGIFQSEQLLKIDPPQLSCSSQISEKSQLDLEKKAATGNQTREQLDLICY